MADKSTVANDLRRFATFVKGLTDAADTLDQMQALEETALATEQRVAAAQSALIDLAAQAQTAQKEIADMKAAAAEAADVVTAKAAAKAAAIQTEAETRAAGIGASAQTQAAAFLADAQTQRDALMTQITSMGEQIDRMTDDRDNLVAAIAAATDDLTVVEGKLAAARDAVAKMLVG